MSLWVLLFLGPVVTLLAGYGLIQAFSLLSRLDNDTFAGLIRIAEGMSVTAVILFAIALLVGVVALWQVHPLLSMLMLVIIAANATIIWTLMRRRGASESDQD